MAKQFDPRSIRDASDIGGRLKDIESRLRSLETSSGLESASFSGTLRVAPGGVFVVDGGADITMNGGGQLRGNDGASIELMHAGNSVPAIVAGTVTSSTGTGYGLQVNSSTYQNIFTAGQNTTERFIAAGDPQEPADRFASYSNSFTVTTYGTVGEIRLASSGGVVSAPGLVSSSTAGVPMHINATTGRIYQYTSSARFKQDIRDARDLAGPILGLRAREFRHVDDVAEDPDSAPAVGFIAEEVESAGLSEAVVKSDGENADGLRETAIITGLVQLCQQQQAEINELRSRIEAIENGQTTSL